MKERLLRVQEQVAAQLREYEHLVRRPTETSTPSDSCDEPRGAAAQPAPFLLDVVTGAAALQGSRQQPDAPHGCGDSMSGAALKLVSAEATAPDDNSRHMEQARGHQDVEIKH